MSKDTMATMVKEAMKAAIKARKVPVLVGDPGTGKTETVRELTETFKGYELITILGSQMDNTDVVGLPKGEEVMKDDDGKPIYGTVYLAPWWQVKIMQHKKIVLFLDEFSNTSGSVRASMLTMLQNREFPNGTVMPHETIVIGAMNPVDQAADGYELDLPTTNRLFFIPWTPSINSWKEGMASGWGKELSKEEMNWKHKIVGFINDNPGWLHQLPKDVGSPEAYGVNPNDVSQMEVLRSAWPSRRSWDTLSKILAHAPNDVSIQDMIAQGVVGYAATGEFRAWLRKNNTINPQDVIDDPMVVNWKEMSLDDSNLLFRSLVAMIDAKNSANIIKVFEVVADAGRYDLGAPHVQEAIKAATSKSLPPNIRAANIEVAKNMLKKYREISRKST